MNELTDFDPDEQALTKKPRPWGWFAAGAALIGAGALFLGYYVPLQSAHGRLLAEHETLAKKASELDHAFQSSQKAMKSTDADRTRLQKGVDTFHGAQKSLTGRYEVAAATARGQLSAFIKAKHLAIDVDRLELVFDFADRILYRPRNTALAPRIVGTLCKATESMATQKNWVVTVVTGAPADEKDYWQTASEKASNVADALEKSCKIPGDRILAQARGPVAGDEGLRTELRIGPQEKPALELPDATPPPAEDSGEANAP